LEGTNVFKRVLIANRGEIAVRVARAAAALGVESVAVYAKADALSLHTRVATEARALSNAGDPVRAYLDSESLLAIARESGCDCLHPGYGFLSENARFAMACGDAGLTFIGPRPDTLALFGDKTSARRLAQTLNVPVVPGTPVLATAKDAIAAAEQLGFPVMIKAAAGGGGRGMRSVANADEMDEAFARATSEAKAAFGDGALFLEKLIARPRHIEVQILGDNRGGVLHLHERDCSIQLRNQKVIEIAPAPNLPADLRERILADAVRLAHAAEYANAGTVEFLVDVEKGEHFFIECNPRIQVEHTVTEEVMHIDLVELQFHIAANETLASFGIDGQSSVPDPHGFAVEARILATGGGRLTAYKEPTGPGIRVDSCGYLGYAPPPQFDPMFAKLICRSAHSYTAALEKAVRALDEFHIDGLPTNLASLRAILSQAPVQAGDARTTFLAEHPELMQATGAVSGSIALFEQALAKSPSASLGIRRDQHLLPPYGGGQAPTLEIAEGDVGVECPLAGSVVSIAVKAGDAVGAGDTLLIVSAMKMETAVSAPSAGIVSAIQELAEGDAVEVGQIVAAIAPGEAGAQARPRAGDEGWAPLLAQVQQLKDIAHRRFAPDSTDPGVVRQRSRGKLTAYERIALLLDKDSFREVGSVAGFASYDAEGNIADFTPANHIGGWGKIDMRPAIVCADDFTSRGGHADGAIGAKSRYLDQLSIDFRCPSVRLLDGSSGGGSVAAMVPKQQQEGESSAKESAGAITAGRPRVAGSGGSFLPGHLGSAMYAEQLSTVPVVNVLLGSVVGIGAAKAVLGHFSVMVKDIAQLFVAGPPVVAHAMGYDISKEELGDWRIHCRNGSVDNLAESEAQAMTMTRRFLSYLPPSVYEAPPVVASDDPPGRREEELFTIVPRKRTTTFDMRRAIRLMADADSFFEIGPFWGTDQIAGFVRMNGFPMGVIASDSRHTNGGALTADGCDKLKRHLDVCDLFHLPVLNLNDNPGFAVGLEHEIAGTIRKGGEWMIAFAQVKVPIFTVIMRRSFGVAGNNFATPLDHASARVVWPAADVGGIPPEGGIEAAYKRQLAEAADPKALRAEIDARIESARGPIGPLNRFQMEEMIDPRDTRPLVCEWVENAYRIVRQPARLVPRALGFRP
jgi:acetyl/propionyl-CoA carboxylase alpha subunit/acetyl-CoA carboxylase carboxyltransferase component